MDVCIIVRTYHGHTPVLQTLVDSLVIEKHQQANIPKLSTRVFLVDTESNADRNLTKLQEDAPQTNQNMPYAKDFNATLDAIVAHGNQRAGRPDAVYRLDCPLSTDPDRFGYDATDWALQYILENYTAGSREHTCTHLMFTNGDNYYLPSLLPDLEYHLSRKNDLVAWDFVTHLPRRNQHNMVKVAIKPRFIDLGAYCTKTRWIRQLGVGFQKVAPPDAEEVLRYYSADYYMAKALADIIPENRIFLIHHVRLAHN